MKKIILFLFIVSINFFIYSESNGKSVIPDNIIDISINGGCGLYIGDFGVHLYNSGAYLATPTMDIYLSLFIIKYFGVLAVIGNGSVIHPASQPIEGNIFYLGMELFGIYDWKYAYMKIFSGAGYQNTTMLLQWYSSGFFEAGLEVGIKLTQWMYINNAVKYRMGFLGAARTALSRIARASL